ncbi:hypothetical protein MSMEI_2650 [Mycolicibacterium smegmatis MC2 155]|uniref:Uncharacterized protein n=1 Tax=Mycolicibacterium smegmatis (strain ATCC 700084 / mc(2)155) TaxID=246196 RepID=I7FK39_MYCS2|nr:hypothetical protein MSMEI_2650 [Mycolicibacterium smegmatis MC2 155]
MGEQQIAGPAHAHQLPAFDVDDVLVVSADRFCAHLAALVGLGKPGRRGRPGSRGSGPGRPAGRSRSGPT